MKISNSIRARSSGQVLVAAIFILMIIAVFLPSLIKHIKGEANLSTKGKQATSAFHLAEAGVDRGLWKLTESEAVWDAAVGGTTAVPGFEGDVVYTDVSGGEYKIDFSPGSGTNQVRVVAKGRDASNREMRAIEAVFTKEFVDESMISNSPLIFLALGLSLRLHWGRLVSNKPLTILLGDYYPRKFSAAGISPRDTVDDSNNTDGLEYWAFQDDIQNLPQIDLAYYKQRALASTIPTVTGTNGLMWKAAPLLGAKVAATASPLGSGYFKASDNPAGIWFGKNALLGGAGYDFRNSTAVIYIDKDVGGSYSTTMNAESFLDIEALICANHNLNFNANQTTVYLATIPATAPGEYLHPNAAGYWNTNFKAVYDSNPQHCCKDIGAGGGLGAHAFIYTGSISLPLASKLYGSLYIANSSSGLLNLLPGVGIMDIYYDKNLADKIALNSKVPTRVSWREIKTSW